MLPEQRYQNQQATKSASRRQKPHTNVALNNNQSATNQHRSQSKTAVSQRTPASQHSTTK
jgi:hypothetical protein